MQNVMEIINDNPKLREAYDELEKKFVSRLVIQGKPDKKLEDALHKVSDELFEAIWNKTFERHDEDPDNQADQIDRRDKSDSDEGVNPDDHGGIGEVDGAAKSRADREKILAGQILADLETALPFLSPHELDLFSLATYCSDATDPGSLSEVFEELVMRGLCFAYSVDSGSFVFEVPEEVVNVLQKLKTPEVEAEYALVCTIRRAHEICAALYGVYRSEYLVEVLKAMSEGHEDEDYKVFTDHLAEISEVLLDERIFETHGEIYVSHGLDEEAARAILEKRGDDWFRPNEESLASFLRPDIDGYWRDDDYDVMVRALNVELKDMNDARFLADEIFTSFREKDWSMSDCMNYLKKEDVGFISREQGERFMRAMISMYRNARRWVLGGFSRAEKGIEVTGQLVVDIAVGNAKIYPNDPCPCGSGKKYKKCCGRK